MKTRERFFEALAALVTRHPGKVLVGCGIITALMLGAATRLGMKTQFADMLPDDIPQIREYLDIIDDYSSDVTVMITVESNDKDIARMRQAADELAARLGNITMLRPRDNFSPTFMQKIALMRGKHPPAIPYDTLSLVRRIDYKLDNDFMERHGLIIQKPENLDATLAMFHSLYLPDLIANINDNFEKEFIEDADNLTTIDGEAQAVQGLEGMRQFLASINRYLSDNDSAAAAEAIAAFISGPAYFISPDNTILLLMVQPAVSFNEYDEISFLGYRIDDTLQTIASQYPDLIIGRTGSLMLQIDENNTIVKDFGWPSVFALLFILLLLIGSFGAWKNPFLAVITLVAGLIWTTGILALTFRYLNMMSAGFSIVLIGLGIDFGIHFISGFRDGRELGKSVTDSIHFMYQRVGAGVITGALTTAVVFYSLPLTRFEAYSQLGFVTGTGIITMLIAQMIMLPALLVWDNKGYSIVGTRLRRMGCGSIVTAWKTAGRPVGVFFGLPLFSAINRLLRFDFLAGSGRHLGNLRVAITLFAVAIVLALLSLRAGMGMEWEYDFMKLYPKEMPGVIAQNKILDKFEMSPDFAMVKARDLDECRSLVDEFKRVGNRTGLIASVDAITEFLPEERQQRENAEKIVAFRQQIIESPLPADQPTPDPERLRSELVRLHQNIVEIGEMSILSGGVNNKIIAKTDQITGRTDDESAVLALAERIGATRANTVPLADYQRIASRILRERLLTMSSPEPVTFASLPDDIRKRYINPKNSDLLINVYPKGSIWDEKSLTTFNRQVATVSERTTGMPIIIQLLMNLMGKKGREAMVIGAIAIALFLLLDFRSFTYVLLAALPLTIGAFWMVGMMAVSGMKLSIMNFMALPLILGIGIDDGVHVLHRYRIEGRGSIPTVLKFTGRAILLTSLTTMIGFGSIGTASHVGLAQFGMTLFYGVGACFISSAYVLPAVLTIKEHLFPATLKPGNNPPLESTTERNTL